MLKRTRVRAKRPTLRRGEPSVAEKAEARRLCYERACGQCERCGKPVPFDGGLLVRMHLAHLKAKRRYGWREDPATGQRHICACPDCHLVGMHNPKPVPRGEWRDTLNRSDEAARPATDTHD